MTSTAIVLIQAAKKVPYDFQLMEAIQFQKETPDKIEPFSINFDEHS